MCKVREDVVQREESKFANKAKICKKWVKMLHRYILHEGLPLTDSLTFLESLNL